MPDGGISTNPSQLRSVYTLYASRLATGDNRTHKPTNAMCICHTVLD